MRNNKRTVFIILFLLFSSVLVFRILSLIFNTENLNHQKENNSAELIELVGPDKIVFGENGIESGYYDICVKEDVNTNAFSLKKGHCLLNQYYYDNNVISTTDNVRFRMIPSKFNVLDFSKGIACLENVEGSFQVGVEIAEGTYEVKLESNYDNHQIFIQISNSKNDLKDEMQIKNGEKIKIKLEDEEFIFIKNLDPNYNFKVFININ